MCLHNNAMKKNPTPSGFNYTNNSMNAQGPSAHLLPLLFLLLLLLLQLSTTSAQLRVDHYRNTCPNVESIVHAAVKQKFEQTFVTAPGTLRLFFHDCFIRGCDASVILAFRNNSAEKNNPDDMSLAGDGFDTVIKAKAAVDRVDGCRNKVSCADILAMATRDVITLSGGPYYAVELGRLDGRTSTKTSVRKHLPHPDFKVDQLKAMFAKQGLTLTDLVALSGAHTIGFSHCDRFNHRIHNFKSKNRVDPTMNLDYAMSLRKKCPKNVDPRTAITLDPSTPQRFDNMYYKNLEQGRGLLASDQCLFTDPRTRHIVNFFAANNTGFRHAFVAAITKLGRVGVKTGSQGEIRRDCTAVNY